MYSNPLYIDLNTLKTKTENKNRNSQIRERKPDMNNERDVKVWREYACNIPPHQQKKREEKSNREIKEKATKRERDRVRVRPLHPTSS